MVLIKIHKIHFRCINPGKYSYKTLAELRFKYCDTCEKKCWRWNQYEDNNSQRRKIHI